MEFKVGDKVKCIKEDRPHLEEGMIYIVTSIGCTTIFINNETGAKGPWAKDRFKLLSECDGPKIGDKVIATEQCKNDMKDGEGIIEKIYPYNKIEIRITKKSKYYGVGALTCRSNWLVGNNLKLAPMKFKVGDKVKFVHKEGEDIKRVPDYETMKGIPNHMIKHGATHFGDKYYKEGGLITNKFNEYYIVEYDDNGGKKVRLGFKEKYLVKFGEVKKQMEKIFEVGDKVRRISDENYNLSVGTECEVTKVDSGGNDIKVDVKDSWLGVVNFELIEKGGKKMELKNIKLENLKEAKKKVEEEKTNAEIEGAKIAYKDAIDNINRIDREIKTKEEEKKTFQEILNMYNAK